MFYVVSTHANATTWSQPETVLDWFEIPGNEDVVVHPSLTCDENTGKFLLLFQFLENSTNTMKYAYTTYDRVSWSDPEVIDQDHYDSDPYNEGDVVALNGRWIMTFRCSPRICMVAVDINSHQEVTSHEFEAPYGNSQCQSVSPRISSDGVTSLVVTWSTEGCNGASSLWSSVSRDYGDNWEIAEKWEDMPVSEGRVVACPCAVESNSEGLWVFMWTAYDIDDVQTGSVIFSKYSTDDLRSFSEPAALTDPDEVALLPQLNYDGNGHWMALWQQQINSQQVGLFYSIAETPHTREEESTTTKSTDQASSSGSSPLVISLSLALVFAAFI
eukprot:TRINITY_DN679_c0_g1_i3.p1 TRINITY_DN679_c0_g1~~TRINITY_DN679_c0_g1_i3.p1  ORF type:complete len:329 (-),score=50.93 TRINITY_DN679_c0_g1_i3:67-1053(-)